MLKPIGKGEKKQLRHTDKYTDG